MNIKIDCTDVEDAIAKLEDFRNDIENGDTDISDMRSGEILFTDFGEVEAD